ncbi:hypothetical protein [Nocardioides sp. SYSU DS0663]|uniref:hypothetical protein n=1 Tax=Nocardioides sp. SYSU DS0663 TaxID=3416445 RepID=UPI003F4B3F9F
MRRILEVSAVALSAAAITFGLSFAAMRTAPASWASFPQWLEAVATGLAVVAAAVAALYAARAFGLERAREDRWQADQRRAQAALVAAWASGPSYHHDRAALIDGLSVRSGIDGARVRVRNASDIPVARVTVDVSVDLSAEGAEPMRRVSLGTHALPVLGPAVTEDVVVHADEVLTFNDPDVSFEDVVVTLRVGLSFIDAAGVLWRRNDDGRLRELGDLSWRY